MFLKVCLFQFFLQFAILFAGADVPSNGKIYFIKSYDSSYLRAAGDNVVCQKIGTVYTTKDAGNALAIKWKYNDGDQHTAQFDMTTSDTKYYLNEFTMDTGSPFCYHTYRLYTLITVGNEQYQFKHKNSGKCLQAIMDKQGITWEACRLSPRQLWTFEETSL